MITNNRTTPSTRQMMATIKPEDWVPPLCSDVTAKASGKKREVKRIRKYSRNLGNEALCCSLLERNSKGNFKGNLDIVFHSHFLQTLPCVQLAVVQREIKEREASCKEHSSALTLRASHLFFRAPFLALRPY